ncbi:hypothetical protein H1C71_013065 [Ictidomys tridecemlineatus]|uniref:G-protein coupled receptors family 1 profile domain-containing protein n=1 Tax=Ictidomys tridecemlineatus TaxID=43179 RepID=A0A287CT02_ICTTR|nr:hypothetical protein H1C71_013065 [Ictidomys tridecemlineatus]
MKNHTLTTEFILLGLTGDPEFQVVIFICLIITYILNSYIFLFRNFSVLEIIFTTVCIPGFLGTIITKDKSISNNNCTLFISIFLSIIEYYLLTAMPYDRYVAIYKPLHYTTIMNKRVYILLVFCAWLAEFLNIFPPVILFFQLDYCGSNEITLLVIISFYLIEFSSAVVILLFTLALINLSYMFIMRTILIFPFASQRKKAFSTNSSHMIVIFISYGSCKFIYLNVSAKERASLTTGVAILNTSVQVKQASKATIQKVMLLSGK